MLTDSPFLLTSVTILSLRRPQVILWGENFEKYSSTYLKIVCSALRTVCAKQQSGEWKELLQFHFLKQYDIWEINGKSFKFRLCLLWCSLKGSDVNVAAFLTWLPPTVYMISPPLSSNKLYDPPAVLHVYSLISPGALLPLSPNRSQEQTQETDR